MEEGEKDAHVGEQKKRKVIYFFKKMWFFVTITLAALAALAIIILCTRGSVYFGGSGHVHWSGATWWLLPTLMLFSPVFVALLAGWWRDLAYVISLFLLFGTCFLFFVSSGRKPEALFSVLTLICVALGFILLLLLHNDRRAGECRCSCLSDDGTVTTTTLSEGEPLVTVVDRVVESFVFFSRANASTTPTTRH